MKYLPAFFIVVYAISATACFGETFMGITFTDNIAIVRERFPNGKIEELKPFTKGGITFSSYYLTDPSIDGGVSISTVNRSQMVTELGKDLIAKESNPAIKANIQKLLKDPERSNFVAMITWFPMKKPQLSKMIEKYGNPALTTNDQLKTSAEWKTRGIYAMLLSDDKTVDYILYYPPE